IKSPSSQPRSADGLEHKVYFSSNLAIDTTIIALTVPVEVDAGQAINPTSFNFRAPGSVPPAFTILGFNIPSNWPGWNQYIPSISDQNTLTGGTHPHHH